MVKSKGKFSIVELADLIQQDGLGTTVAYGVAPEHIADIRLAEVWKATQQGLQAIQDYIDERDSRVGQAQIVPANTTKKTPYESRNYRKNIV